MKVAELTGALLDVWVARVIGLPVAGIVGGECFIRDDPNPWRFRPTTSWEQAGAIIERECIAVRPCLWISGQCVEWSAEMGLQESHYRTGDTPLIAAMRAYVASKFGAEVPDEVQP
jgi:hypothetical protein